MTWRSHRKAFEAVGCGKGMLVTLLGVLVGALTGLVPGLHSNLVAALLVGVTDAPVELLLAMATTHLFVTIIPSIYLSLPDDATGIGLLPGQALVKDGRGYEGVLAHANAALLSLLVLVPTMFFVVNYLPSIARLLSPAVPFLLLLVLVHLLGIDKRVWRILIMGLAGLLGLVSMGVREPLLPLLSGLFGFPALLLTATSVIPPQRQIEADMTRGMRAMLPLGWLTGSLVGFLPGVGTAHAAAIASVWKSAPKTTLALLSSIATANFVFSLATSASINKARNGVVALLLQYPLPSDWLWTASATVLAAGGMAYLITRAYALFFARHAAVLVQPSIRYGLLVFITLLVVVLSGWQGLLVLGTATAIGLLPVLLNIERSIMMSALIVPVLFFLWPF